MSVLCASNRLCRACYRNTIIDTNNRELIARPLLAGRGAFDRHVLHTKHEAAAVEPTGMYKAVTRGIRVCVMPQYLDEHSSPEEGHFFWAYAIEIANEGAETVQLRARAWRITDGQGRTAEMGGPGVFGKTPVIEPGSSYSYTFGYPLRTPSGIMVGRFRMADANGKIFDVDIPAFSLDSPFAMRSVN